MFHSTSGDLPGAATPGRFVSIALALLLGTAAPPDARGEPVREAQAFLSQSQLASGAFPGVPVVDTVEALRALSNAEEGDAATLAVLLSIPDNGEALFARAGALAGTPYADRAASDLALELIGSGTLGLAQEHASAGRPGKPRGRRTRRVAARAGGRGRRRATRASRRSG